MNSPIPDRFLKDRQITMAYGVLKQDTVIFDTNVDFDDCLEFRFSTDKAPWIHRMLTNAKETHYDYRFTKTTRELKWNPKWETKNILLEEEWHIEGKIPLADIGGVPEKGALWHFNAYRVWKLLKTTIETWANDDYSINARSFNGGQLRMAGDDAPVFQITSLDALKQDEIKLNIAVTNRSESPLPLNAVLDFGTNGGEKTIKITAQPKQKINLAWDVKPENKPIFSTITITSQDGKQLYFRQITPLFTKSEPVLEAVHYVLQNKVVFNGDITPLGLAPEKTSVVLGIYQNGKAIEETKLQAKTGRFTKTMNLPKDLPNGKYSANITLVSNGKTISESSNEISIEPMPEWYGNKLGYSDTPPPPWTPLKMAQNSLYVWNREYKYGSALFPDQIISAKEKLLAAPIELQLADKYGRITLTPAKLVSSESDACTAHFVRTATAKGIKVTLDTTAEFDGMLWNKLTIEGADRNLTEAKLVVKMPKAQSTLMMPHDYSLLHTGYTHNWSDAMRPIWIGNEERGLDFAAEAPFKNGNKHELSIEIGPSETTFTVDLIGGEKSLATPLVREFSLMATPIKAPRADHRTWVPATHPKASLEAGTPGTMIVQLPFRRWGWPPMYETCYPVFNTKLERPVNYKIGDTPARGLLYTQTEMLWSDSPEFKRFGPEWSSEIRITPSTAPESMNRQNPVCQSVPSYQDFMVYMFHRIHQQTNNLGFYFDVAQPKLCFSREHGCASIRDGALQPTTNIRGTRQLMKRIYTMMKAEDPNTIILHHISGQITLPSHSFSDILYDGENFISQLKDNCGYPKTLTLPVYRAEYMGRNLGPVSMLLPEFRINDNAKAKRFVEAKPLPNEKDEFERLQTETRYILGITLLHDSNINSGFIYDSCSQRDYYLALRELDFARLPYDFIPYWKQTITEKHGEDDLVISFYTCKERTFAVIMNMKPETRDVQLTLDTRSLGKSFTGVSCLPQGTASLNGRQLKIDNLKQYHYRIIVFNQK